MSRIVTRRLRLDIIYEKRRIEFLERKIKMSELKKYLKSGLSSLLIELLKISELKSCEHLNVSLRLYPLAKIILLARKEDGDWVWSKDEIKIDEETGEFTLSSVDICWAFGCQGHNNLRLNMQTKHKINTTNYVWDTEYSAWYPRFRTREAAERCIDDINKVFDKKYLLELEAVEVLH